MRTVLILIVSIVVSGCGAQLIEDLGGTLGLDVKPIIKAEGNCLTYIDGHSAGKKVRDLKICLPPTAPHARRVELTAPTGLEFGLPPGFEFGKDATQIQGVLNPGDSICVPMFFANIAPNQPATKLDVKLRHLVAGTLVEADTETFDFVSRPTDVLDEALAFLGAAGVPGPYELTEHEIGKKRWESTWLHLPRTPEPEVETVAHVAKEETLDDQAIADQAAAFPEGLGPNGLTLLPSLRAPAVSGDWLHVALVLDAPVPGFPPEPLPPDPRQYVIATKLDEDDDNDYQAPAGFPGDTVRGVDIYFELNFNPATGNWTYAVFDARGGTPQEIPSASRAVLSENTLSLAIPPGEFLDCKQLFFSAYRHDGTFGLQQPYDWSIDYHPTRDDEPEEPVGIPPPGPGSPEAQAFDGTWRLDGVQDHCMTISFGTITSWRVDCTVPLGIIETTPGHMVTPSLIEWEIRTDDGRRFRVLQNVDTSVPNPTTLDVFSSPQDTAGVRTFPDLVTF